MSQGNRNSALKLNLSGLLAKRGMSQAELGRQAGMSAGAIADLISGKNALPSDDNLVAILDALGIKKIDLLIEFIPKEKRSDNNSLITK